MSILSRAPSVVDRPVVGAAGLVLVGLALLGDLRATQLPPELQPRSSTQALASIAGRVVDGVTGRPIANASVYLYGVPVFDVTPNPGGGGGIMPAWAGPSCSTRSDSEGRFTCNNLDPWPYEITVRKDGASGAFGQRTPEDAGRVLTPTADQRMQNVRVPLWRDAIVSGRVLDPQGEPLINMTVVAIPTVALTTPSSNSERQLRRDTSTDDRGAYTLPVAPGEYVLAAMPGAANGPRTEIGGRPAIYPTSFLGDTSEAGLAQRLVLAAGTAYDDVNIIVRPVVSHRLTGLASGPAPVAGATVELVRDVPGDSALSRETPPARVDESGRFSLPDVPSGQYRLRILRAPQLPTGSHGNPPLEALPTESTLWANVPVVVGDDDLTVDVALDRGVRISGRVVFEGGEGPRPADIARATFTLTPLSGQWMDARGLLLSRETFATIELVPGSYLLNAPYLPEFYVTSVTRGGRSILNEPIDVGTSDITDVVMTLSRQATTLSGSVTRPPALTDTRGSVTIVPADSSGWKDLGRETRMQTVLIGMPGTFDLSPRPGDYLAIATDRPVPRTREGLALMEARATRVSLLPGSATRLNLQLQEWPR